MQARLLQSLHIKLVAPGKDTAGPLIDLSEHRDSAYRCTNAQRRDWPKC